MVTKIYEVIFEKYKGETITILAANFAEAVKNSLKWSKREKYGNEINSIKVYGAVNA